MRASTIRNLLLLCCLVVFVCGTSSEKICNCEHCRCAANAATSTSASASAGGGGGGAVQVSNLPPATKVAYVADEVLSSFPTCKDCGEYHHHHHHHHQQRSRSNNDHSSAQIYRQEAARRVSEPCRCQLKVGNGNELRTTIRLEPTQQEAVTKIVLPKNSPKSEQISSVSVVPSNIARIVKKKELLKKESETTLKPLLIDFEQLQKLLTSGSLTNNNNAASDKDKRMPTPIILYVVAAPNAALEKSKPIEAAKGSEPISEPVATPKARANNDSEPLRMTQLAGRTSTQGFAKKFRRSPNLRQRRLDESTQASSTAVPTAIKASKISLKTTTTTTTTTTSAPPHRSSPRPLGQWLRGLRQLGESSTEPSESSSSSSDFVTERSKRWIKNPTNGHAAPVRPPPPARSPVASKKVPKKTLRRINGSGRQPRQQQPLEGPDTRMTLSSLEKSFTAAGAVSKKKKTASLKKRLSPQLAPKSATQEEQSAAAPKSPSKPASSSASKLASDDSTSDSLDTVVDQQQRRYKLVRRHLSSRGQNNDYWIMRIPKRNESTFATVIADAANFVAKLFSNGRRSYDRD
ncbi:unnamed protein product [Trichogramma brassicae]|uniref:Uncharacterized protein n=1 Tax=Trichogramma brassicae TaxID=86971 RepID=A0A6H5IMA0_9HYME|nr:unnamed protein product [Trichogramma brassicae]